MTKRISLSVFAFVAVAALLILVARSAFAQPKQYLTGLVYIDSNQNGMWDKGEEGYKGAYGVAKENGNWIWRYRGTDVTFKGMGSGPKDAIVLQTAGHRGLNDGEVDPCSRQGDGRPCNGTFGMRSTASNVTWQVSLKVPQHYRLTTPGMVNVRSGVANKPIEFGIAPMANIPMDDTQPVLEILSDGLGEPISGGSARLMRNASSISVDFNATNLPAGHVVTLWAYTFNDPTACDADGCDEDDVFVNGMTPPLWSNADGTVGRAGTDFTLLGLGGHVIGSSGTQTFSGSIAKNTAPQVVFGNGLNNPLGAEIHFALRDHGPASADPVTLNAQLTSGIGGCRNFGGTGTYLCRDFQIALFGR